MEYNEYRRKSKKIKIGNIYIGGDSPVAVQTMANTDSHDIAACIRQVSALEASGADIIRIAVPDNEAVKTLSEIKEHGISVPIVADIHFDHRLALDSVAAGADKIRINPGNIGGEDKVKLVADACRKKSIPIRVGVNSGSIQKDILAKYGGPCDKALAESALQHVKLLESFDFENIVISVKASDVRTTVGASRIIAESCDYPLHLGVTEAGTECIGVIRSAVGIGSLLCDGIGDTIRVSLTADPEKEIFAGRDLLSSIGIEGGRKINIVSCPSCGRTKIDLIHIAQEIESRISKEIPLQRKKMTVAVMGCAVNGPGEAREADIGIAGGDGYAVLFRHGEICMRIEEEKICDILISEIEKFQNS